MPIELDILLFVKETQLQHGLRAENFDRYHHYLSNRLATLRRQLNLANDKKRFLNRDVTPQNATDSRYLMLLALYAERCWAEAEAMQRTIMLSARQQGNEASSKHPGGIPPKELPRKRHNKAAAWATQLAMIAEAVGSQRTKYCAAAYRAEAAGRCALAHGRFAAARVAFQEAYEACLELQSCSDESQWPVVVSKLGELHDRVIHSIQCLGQDPALYIPKQANAGSGSQNSANPFAFTVEWNQRKLNIYSVKIKDVLREVSQCEWPAAKTKALESAGANGIVPVGQQHKALEVVDRVIGLYNDALVHARQDLRGSSDSQRQEMQLLVHYLSYHAQCGALERTRFMILVFQRRFAATRAALQSQAISSSSAAATEATSTAVSASHFASPLEVVRLYDGALEILAEMELLPGVSGRADVEAWISEARAGKLLYAAEAWRAAGDFQQAMSQYKASEKILSELKDADLVDKDLPRRVTQAMVTLSAQMVLSKAAPVPIGYSKFLADSLDEFAVASHVTKFPPDYQAVACKPVFIDIASTFVDYPSTSKASAEVRTSATSEVAVQAAQTASQSTSDAPTSNSTQATIDGQQQGGKKWGWGWGGWGKK